MKLAYYAYCQVCDFWDDTERADPRANSHTKNTGHPTLSGATPATRPITRASCQPPKPENAR